MSDNNWNASIQHRAEGTTLRVLASDARRAHGRAGFLLLLDEPAMWPRESSEKMYSALSTTLGKIPGGRLIAIGTMPVDPTSWFSKLLKNADVGMTFAADRVEVAQNPFDWRHVRKANPSLNLDANFERCNP